MTSVSLVESKLVYLSGCYRFKHMYVYLLSRYIHQRLVYIFKQILFLFVFLKLFSLLLPPPPPLGADRARPLSSLSPAASASPPRSVFHFAVVAAILLWTVGAAAGGGCRPLKGKFCRHVHRFPSCRSPRVSADPAQGDAEDRGGGGVERLRRCRQLQLTAKVQSVCRCHFSSP